MRFEDFLSKITPELYKTLRRSLELGKWPDGSLLKPEQKSATLQALMIYECKEIPEKERIGYMPQHCKSKRPKRDDTVDSIIQFKL
ncbi:MAG: DUF1315 family protein [Candidatus Endonucleobacter bathymodioli]|uniref:DUF1315 family protein n=1 Tax=Candidatus Endonucleibacter bathymodioli TaxID=539814 RepID=A0AA90NL58_9GAMM|nr:DUF1315 family protein [Candidatus Endonucleobacter bathymodioli]